MHHSKNKNDQKRSGIVPGLILGVRFHHSWFIEKIEIYVWSGPLQNKINTVYWYKDVKMERFQSHLACCDEISNNIFPVRTSKTHDSVTMMCHA